MVGQALEAKTIEDVSMEQFSLGLKPSYEPRGIWISIFKIGDLIEKTFMVIATACFFTFLGVVALDVFMRELFTPILWGQEMSLFTYMWSIFLGGTVVYRRKKHLVMDLLPSINPTIDFIVTTVVFGISVVFAYFFLTAGWKFSKLGIIRISRPSGFPLIYSFISIPIAGFGMLFFSLELFYTDILSFFKKRELMS